MTAWYIVLTTALAGIILPQAVRVVINIAKTRNYFWGPVAATLAAGYAEKKLEVRPGLTINYAEGPAQGVPLLLVHGQGMIWQDYGRVLPDLARTYHVVAVDCHGHGATTWNPDDYRGTRIADDLAVLIDQVFGQPCVVSGHSSGGMIATLIAARHPDKVKGLVIEDAPFFSTEPERAPKTFSYIDTFDNVAGFVSQTEEPDWVCYYMPRSYWKGFFQSLLTPPIGAKLWAVFTRSVIAQRRADPDALPLIRWAGVSINRIWESYSHSFDMRFAQTFCDFTWFDFDQADTLAQVRCPSTYIKTTTRVDKQGNLLAALSEDDVNRAHSLLADDQVVRVRSGHDVHFEHPAQFVQIMTDFAKRI